MDEQELNKKLAEHFELEYTVDGQTTWIRDPDTGQWQGNWLTQSLDACFKWLIPKASERHPNLSITLFFDTLAQEKACRLKEWDNLGWQLISYAYAETSALALCLAIEKLIDEEAKG